MKWHRRSASIRVPELFVRPALTNLSKTKPLENGDHLRRFEHGQVCHLSHHHHLCAHKTRDGLRLAKFFK